MVHLELEQYLKQFEPLKGVSVGYKTPEAGMIAPFLVTISGYVSLYGEVHYFETDLDLREIGSAKDLERLVVVLIESIQRAERHVESVH